MKTYPQIVRENILPLSIAGNLPEAFKEWYFTENTEDHGSAIETCQLCGKEEIRYHFEIENENTGNQLWVGSHCILKFHLSVYEGDILLDEKAAKKKLDQLTKKMQLESCMKSLEKLVGAEENEILKNALEFYKTNKYLTPKYASVVFWRLNENKIDYRPSFFKIGLKKDRYKQALKELPTYRVHNFWKALSASQKKLAISFGHYPPSENEEPKS